MAGEAPGRKQNHEVSGEAGANVASDPRLAVFRSPGEVREARAAQEVSEEHAGPASGGPGGPGGARPPRAQDTAREPGPAPRPHSAAASTAVPESATDDDVAAVDTLTDPGTPAAPPAPRSADDSAEKTEPNRDHAEGAEAPSGAGGAVDTGGDSAESTAPDDPAGSEESVKSGKPEESAPAERRPAAGANGSARGRTPVAEGGARTADAQEGGVSPAVGSASAKAGSGTARSVAAGSAKSGSEAAGSVAAGSAKSGSATADGAAGSASSAPAKPGAAPAAEPKAAPMKPQAGRGAGPDNGSAAKPAAGSVAEPAADVRPKAAAPAAPPAPAPGKPVVKPLVSDLPEERPGGAQDGSSGRSAPYRGPVAFGPPGSPARADGAPQAPPSPQSPAPGARSGAQSTASPSARPAPAPLPPAARPGPADGTGSGTASGAQGTAPAPDRAVGPEGTRPMPVPAAPEAPLKLLAELTNTPPPPQTALRTVGRRFKIWTPLVVLLAIVFVVVQAVRPLPSPSLDLTAAGSYAFHGTPLPSSMPWPTEGQSAVEVEGLGSLGVHGAQTPVPMASVTKVMTAYVVLHDHPLTGKADGPTITVDKQAADEAGAGDQSTAPVKEGQRFGERTMLQLLLIPSGNNIARLLARWDAGTQQAFVAKMTRTAASLGMTHTTYTGASGIEETTVSTAVDQLKLAREVMKNDVFRSVVALPNVTIPGVGRIFNNNNDLVRLGVVGIKTGSSTPAGGALMWAAHKTVDGKQQLVLGVVLQQHGGTTVDDSLQTALTRSQALIDSVQGGLTSATIVKKGEVVGKVDDGLGGSTPVVAAQDLTAIGWAGMRSDLVLTASGGLPHQAKAGTRVGTLAFGSGSARTTVPVVLQSDLAAPSFGTKLTRTG